MLALSTPVSAATIDAGDLIRGFSVIALGDYTLSSDTPSPVFVGGNFRTKGNQSINTNNDRPDVTVGDVSGSLIVGGEVRKNSASNVNGNVVIGGNQTVTQPSAGQQRFFVDDKSEFNLNRDGATVTAGRAVPVETVRTALLGLSADLAGLDDTGTTITGDSSNKTLNANAGTDGVAVANFDAESFSAFFSGSSLAFDLGGASTLILNAELGGIETLTFKGLNLNDFSGANNVILNLAGVDRFDIRSTFGISLLAPTVNVVAKAGGTNGFVVANDLDQRYEIRGSFTGDLPEIAPVPLPATIWLLGLGALGLGAMRRRRDA